jgi:hypothetical protein
MYSELTPEKLILGKGPCEKKSKCLIASIAELRKVVLLPFS